MRDSGCIGVENLRIRIGKTQVRLIKAKLPQLKEVLKRKHATVSTAIEEMGDIPKNSTERRNVYEAMGKRVVDHLSCSLTGKGDLSYSKFTTSLHNDCEHFKERIQEGSWGTIRKIAEEGVDFGYSELAPVGIEIDTDDFIDYLQKLAGFVKSASESNLCLVFTIT